MPATAASAIATATAPMARLNGSWSALARLIPPSGRAVTASRQEASARVSSFSDCHNSDYSTAPIVVIASRLRACPGGTKAYSRLQYVFVGTSPFQGLPAHVSFKNFMDAPDRPHPPKNQTVSLAC